MEKKKFRINIIDIIILVLIVCVAVFAVMKFSDGGKVSAATNTQKIQVVFYQEECADYVIAATKVGDPVYDATFLKDLGVVTGLEVSEPISYEVLKDSSGEPIGSVGPIVREGYHSVKIITEVEGTMTDHGFMMGESLYSVGHTLVLHAGQGKYYLKIYSITPLGD